MELPKDIWRVLVTYLNVDSILEFRCVSKEYTEHAKEFQGDNTMIIYNTKLWHKSFPNAKYSCISHRRNLTEDDFIYLTHVEELVMRLSTCKMKREIFHEFVNLRKLDLHGCHHYLGGSFNPWLSLHGIKHLKKLTHLSIDNSVIFNDEILSKFKLESLKVYNCYNITDEGFKNQTALKQLEIYNQQGITDKVFDYIPLQELTVIHNANISDLGIVKLSQLKKLFTRNTIQVRGVGFSALKKLEMLYLSNIILDTQYKDFANVQELRFCQCELRGTDYTLWNAERIHLQQCMISHPYHLLKLSYMPKLKKLTVYHCADIFPYKNEIKETMIDRFCTEDDLVYDGYI